MLPIKRVLHCVEFRRSLYFMAYVVHCNIKEPFEIQLERIRERVKIAKTEKSGCRLNLM